MLEWVAATIAGAVGGFVSFCVPLAEGQSGGLRSLATYRALGATIVVGAGAGFAVWGRSTTGW